MLANNGRDVQWPGQGGLVKGCSGCGKSLLPGQQKLHTCSGCQMALYCNKDCQRAHWPTHKNLCRLNMQSREIGKVVSPEIRKDAEDFVKWVSHQSAVLTVALHHGLRLEDNPDVYKTKGLIISFAEKPNHSRYPPHQRYNVVQGLVCDLDVVRLSVTKSNNGDLSDFDQALAKGRRMGIMVLCYGENLVRQWQRITMPPPRQLKKAAQSVESPNGSWVTWLDKAVNESFQAKIKFSKPPTGRNGRR